MVQNCTVLGVSQVRAGGPGLLPGAVLNFGQQNQVTVGTPGLASFLWTLTWAWERLPTAQVPSLIDSRDFNAR
jgi:hypothetical protein